MKGRVCFELSKPFSLLSANTSNSRSLKGWLPSGVAVWDPEEQYLRMAYMGLCPFPVGLIASASLTPCPNYGINQLTSLETSTKNRVFSLALLLLA